MPRLTVCTEPVSEAGTYDGENYMIGEMCRSYESAFYIARRLDIYLRVETWWWLFQAFAASREGSHTQDMAPFGNGNIYVRDF